MNGVLSLDDVTSNDGSSNDSENSSDSDDADEHAELRETCEMIGGDFDHVLDYVENNNVDESDLVDFARSLANDEEAWALSEEYRRGNDIHRIIRNFLRSDDREFTSYTGAFYGDSSNPASGTYNDVQQRARANDHVNLMWYKAFFPEPVAEYWDADVVRWHEFDSIGYSDGEQDSHIYVPRDFVEEYVDFQTEIDGEQKIVPPWNDVIDQAGSDSTESVEQDSDDLQQISGIGVQFEQKLNDKGISTLEGLAMADPEKVADHVGGVSADTVRQWQEQVDSSESTDDSQQASLDEVSDDGSRLDKIAELQEQGWTKDEIMELLG